MKKGFTLIDFIITFIIVFIIGIVVILLIKSVLKNIKDNGNKILIDNFANDILYIKELYMKNNDNNIPVYCKINNDIIYYDENNNNKYDLNELLCNKECNDNCIKHFITKNDLDNNIECNIIIEENSIEIDNCYINNKLINYQYKNSTE